MITHHQYVNMILSLICYNIFWIYFDFVKLCVLSQELAVGPWVPTEADRLMPVPVGSEVGPPISEDPEMTWNMLEAGPLFPTESKDTYPSLKIFPGTPLVPGEESWHWGGGGVALNSHVLFFVCCCFF